MRGSHRGCGRASAPAHLASRIHACRPFRHHEQEACKRRRVHTCIKEITNVNNQSTPHVSPKFKSRTPPKLKYGTKSLPAANQRRRVNFAKKIFFRSVPPCFAHVTSACISKGQYRKTIAYISPEPPDHDANLIEICWCTHTVEQRHDRNTVPRRDNTCAEAPSAVAAVL